MIVTGIILLISILFGGSGIPVFIIEDLQKEVKENIKDKDRQKQVLAITKDYEKAVKDYQKQIDKNKKSMKKLNLDKNTPKDSIVNLLNETAEIWKEIQTEGIDDRLKATKLITDAEWENIIANSVSDLSKKEVKSQDKNVEGWRVVT